MEDVSLKKWLRISVFNLLLVASAGFVLRYKIAFSLPWVDQKYLLHGHSHFAFSGWVTQALMSLLVQYLKNNGLFSAFQKYRWLLYANLFTAYGMLISFPLQGYALFSIIFSTLSIFVSYAFAVMFFKDLTRLPTRGSTHLWFKSAILFNVLSSAGAFTLAYMLATRQSNEHLYLAAIYFYLHFQYNGWFLFACMGLLNYHLLKAGVSDQRLKKIFWLFFFACIPTYLLSTLWLKIPAWMYWIVVVAALAQLYAWMLLLKISQQQVQFFKTRLPKFSQVIFILVAIALSVKLILQAVAVIPSISTLAFSYRPIVIGYLHLILLGIISLFILGYIFSQRYFYLTKLNSTGLFIFIAGILINELVLLFQGIGGIMYVPFPHGDLWLLAAAFILFTGLFLLNYGLSQKASMHVHKINQ